MHRDVLHRGIVEPRTIARVALAQLKAGGALDQAGIRVVFPGAAFHALNYSAHAFTSAQFFCADNAFAFVLLSLYLFVYVYVCRRSVTVLAR